MKESTLWLYLKRGMGDRWDAHRHEDSTSIGIPDLSYGFANLQGWIELKVLDRWPVRPDTIVGMPHEQRWRWQRRWLAKRGAIGGSCWMMLRIGREYLLFDWSVIINVGSRNQEETRQMACGYWRNHINWDEFSRLLVSFASWSAEERENNNTK